MTYDDDDDDDVILGRKLVVKYCDSNYRAMKTLPDNSMPTSAPCGMLNFTTSISFAYKHTHAHAHIKINS